MAVRVFFCLSVLCILFSITLLSFQADVYSKDIKDINPGDILVFDPGRGPEEVLVFDRCRGDIFIFWGPGGSKVSYLSTDSFEEKANGNVFPPNHEQYAGLSMEYISRLAPPLE